MLKAASHCSFRHDLHELWSREGVGVKLGIWLPTINCLKARVKWAPIGVCYKTLKRYFWGLNILPSHSQNRFDWERYEHPKFWNNKSHNFRTPIWESWGKVTFRCSSYGKTQNILLGREWCLLPKVVGHVKLVLEVVPTKSTPIFPFNLH